MGSQLQDGDRVERLDADGRVAQRGTFRGYTRDGWRRVVWDGDRSISESNGDIRKSRDV